jgi:hypothetical protein
VRVHADGAAARSTRAVDATAYTVGTHVVFGAGRYAPGTGYEADPVSFSLHVARHVAKIYIDPKLAAEGDMPVCEPPRGSDVHSTDCEVPFKNGPPILVMWNPRSRRTIGRFDSGGVRKRYSFDYSWPGGVLTLKFVVLHTAPTPGTGSPGGAKPGAPQPDLP